MMDHPPVSVEPPLPDRPNGSDGVPQVLDGVVYLPAGHSVEPESPEFESLLRKNLPAEILPDVLTNWRGVSARTTRLQWIVSVICLLAAFGLLYCFFPDTQFDDLKAYEGMEIRSIADPLPFNSPYRSVFHDAEREFAQGNSHAVCRILKNSVEEIIRTKNRKADRVLFLYFQAMQKIHKTGSGSGGAVGLLQELIRQDPDNPNWLQFEIELDPRIRRLLNYDDVRREIITREGRSSIARYLDNARYALGRLDRLKAAAAPPKYSGAELERLKESLDIYRMKLLVACWLLEGYKAGKTGLPDNRDSPGVAEREAALKIALRRGRSQCKDFWQARLFIAEMLCEQDNLFNDIYWNGSYRKTKAPLEQEIQDCRERLDGGEQ